jgi:anthranilate synthase/aminodeoxychorismate synthase-like glutamine amidotransferase
MNVLLVDNYDSFTWNVADLLARLGAQVDVVRNDATSVEDIMRGARYDAIVLSPGPGGPEEAGICVDLVHAAARADVPLLGICLGMQCIGAAYDGSITRLDGVVHGAATPVVHDSGGVFANVPQRFAAGRYHSLVVDEATLPVQLRATAHTEDGVLMGLRHRSARIEGIQFHPESILTPEGPKLLLNFLEEAA